jgi:putative colanic acid biosynthesis acetyltransferase WcaF
LALPAVPPATATAVDPSSSQPWVDLALYDNSDFDPGRGKLIRTLWYYTSLLFFESGWLPVSGVKCRLLRLFGAHVGREVVIKPHVRIKFPWRLTVGDCCWIGQGAWIDNLAEVHIGGHVCISQLAYLCTGSHDYRKRTFDLITKPIRVDDGAWLGARCTVFPGVSVGANALVAGGSIVTKDVPPREIVAGNPAAPISLRQPPPSH